MLGFVISHAVDAGSKDTCVLEVDDTEDVDTVDSLLDILPPPGMQVVKKLQFIGNVDTIVVPGIDLDPSRYKPGTYFDHILKQFISCWSVTLF
jgi:hypothetical protein